MWNAPLVRIGLVSLLAATGCKKADKVDNDTGKTTKTVEPPKPSMQTGSDTNGSNLTAGDLRKVGRVDFAISCKGQQEQFDRALALLHSFFYGEARRVFTEITTKDSSCAIANWGVAMTWYHPIWAPPTPDDLAKGRTAIDAAKAAATKSDREKEFVEALAVFYADQPAGSDHVASGAMGCHGPTGGHTERAATYTAAMQKVYAAHPDDIEAGTFYALSLLGSAKAVDPTLENQKKAAEILEKFWAIRHDHPGVAHYLIHAYDSPQLAAKGLDAAKIYADIAPWVPHALHMPSHIFVRLGMWAESIDVNKQSVDAARNYVATQKLEGMSFEELHALDYLVYGYLQTGQEAKAKALVDHVMTVKKTYPEIDFVASYAVGAVPSRFAVERHAWTEAAALTVPTTAFWTKFPFAEAHIEYARGLGRARSKDIEGAKKSLARLVELRDATSDPKFDYFKQHLALQQQAVAAWIDHAEGHSDAALAALQKAAATEDQLGKNPVSPGPINLIYEQLGDLLVEMNKAPEAIVAYETALKSSPGRLNSILGAGLASEKAGKKDAARTYYQQAVTQTQGGDMKRADLDAAKAFLAKP